MSYDLEVFGVRPVPSDRLAGLVEEAGGRTEIPAGFPGSSPHFEVGRVVRGRPMTACTVDGPLRVERADLPEQVADHAVGITVTYQIAAPTGERPSADLARRIGRGLAEEAGGGVVYDPQLDTVVWPRTTTRRFRPPAAQRLDVLNVVWFVRRAEIPEDLPGAVLRAFRTWLPEASPRRFGGVEPLQHRLDAEGAAGFAREWRAEPMALHWTTDRPCLGGTADGLGETLLGTPQTDHPVGSLHLRLDLRVLDDPRWCTDLVEAFAHLAEVTRAFYAHAGVERGWGHSGGALWADPQTRVIWSPSVRNRWYGLPPYPVWLAWYGAPYLPLVESHLDGDLRRVGRGLLRRDGAHPDEAGSVPWPADLTMTVIPAESPRASPERRPAPRIPAGL